MKIIYIHQYFNTPVMSGGTRSFEMARRMVAAGHEVHMVTSCREAPAQTCTTRWFYTVEAGIHVHWLDNPYSNNMSYRQRIRAFCRYALLASAKARQLGGDVVFATSTPLTVAVPALYAKWRNRIPMVFEVRDLWPEGPIALGVLKNRAAIMLARWLERKAYFGAAHVVALSPEMQKGIIATGYPERRVSTIPNSSDIELFRVPKSVGAAFISSHPHLSGGPLVVYAGTLGLVNGVEYMASLAAAMRSIDPAVRFLVIGEGREEDKIRRQADASGVLNLNFWMMKRIPKNEMPQVLSACSVSLSLVVDHPFHQQNSANKAFDAFAAGRPLAINHGGWLADILKETGAGLVLPPNNAQVAAHQLAAFLSDADRMQRARSASALLAERKFDRKKLANELISVLESTVSTAKTKR